MQLFTLESTQTTPKITMNAYDGLIEIEGISYPEKSHEFYKPVLEWIVNYFKNPQKQTTFTLHIPSFNAGSSKIFFDLFDILEEHKDSSSITVFWHYHPKNKTILETIHTFLKDFQELDIRLIPNKELLYAL